MMLVRWGTQLWLEEAQSGELENRPLLMALALFWNNDEVAN